MSKLSNYLGNPATDEKMAMTAVVAAGLTGGTKATKPRY
jgi:hypothetical protein